jgi:hypothetical protein
LFTCSACGQLIEKGISVEGVLFCDRCKPEITLDAAHITHWISFENYDNANSLKSVITKTLCGYGLIKNARTNSMHPTP